MIPLKNYSDTKDIFQTVFLKYVLSSVSFESKEHENTVYPLSRLLMMRCLYINPCSRQ